MHRKMGVIWVCFAIVFGSFAIVDTTMDLISTAKGTTHYVNETGSGGAFSKIQDAINASSDGDTVFVHPGIYYENLLVDKRINLVGSGSKVTTIDGGEKDHQDVVTLITDGVNLSGFGIINSYMGHEFGGIGIYSSNNMIFDNDCHENLYGLIIWGGQNRICSNSFSNNERDGIFVKSSGNIIENNTCSNSFDRDGIWLYICNDNMVMNNTCNNNAKNGISFYRSNNNTLINNKCKNSGLYDGILIYESSNNVLLNNTLSSNQRGGFSLSHFANNNTLANNLLKENEIGINIYDGSNFNTVHQNNAIKNIYYGIYLSGTSGNRIYHNNIIDNANQSYDDTDTNYWDDGYPSGGNYWSDYDGIDLNSTPTQDIPPSDGIGDTPYIIDADSSDDYPLISLFGNLIFLYEGWNLISIPLIQKEQNLRRVLWSIDGRYDAVQWYDVTDLGNHWKDTKIGKPFGNEMDTYVESMGLWVHVTPPGDTIFIYNGTEALVNQTIDMHVGWNLVGYPSKAFYNRTFGLNNLDFGMDIDAIQWFDGETKTWHFMGPDDTFITGRGYWMHSNIEAVWEVPL